MKKKLILILVIVILIVLEGFVIFSLNKDNDKQDIINLNVNDKLVQKLYKMANPSDNAILLDDLYGKKKLSNKYKIAMGIMDYLKDNKVLNDGLSDYIKEDDVINHIKLTLGETEYKPEDVLIMSGDICGFKYNGDLKRYEDAGGCGDMGYERFYREITSAYKENDRLYIKEKSFFVYNDWNDYYSHVSVFTNIDKKNLIDYYEEDSNGSRDIKPSDYIDKGSVYEYEFKKIDNNNNYIFKGVKRLK